jgi:hypothetical protein
MLHQNVDTCDIVTCDIERLHNERLELQQLVSRFKNSNKRYIQIEITEEVLDRLLAEYPLLSSASCYSC